MYKEENASFDNNSRGKEQEMAMASSERKADMRARHGKEHGSSVCVCV